MRPRWGCDAETTAPVWEGRCAGCGGTGCKACAMHGTVQHKRCPASMASAAAYRIVSLAAYMRQGFLPEPGAINQQPAKLMDLIAIATTEMNSIQVEANGKGGGG